MEICIPKATPITLLCVSQRNCVYGQFDSRSLFVCVCVFVDHSASGFRFSRTSQALSLSLHILCAVCVRGFSRVVLSCAYASSTSVCVSAFGLLSSRQHPASLISPYKVSINLSEHLNPVFSSETKKEACSKTSLIRHKLSKNLLLLCYAPAPTAGSPQW